MSAEQKRVLKIAVIATLTMAAWSMAAKANFPVITPVARRVTGS